MNRRRVALFIGIAAAVLLGLCGIGVGGLWWASRQLEGSWTPMSQAPAHFHVKTEATSFQFRSLGFQDPHYELLFEVKDVDAFLRANALTKAGPTSAPADAPLSVDGAIALEGFVDGDNLYRSGQLWQVGTATYVYLVAFGT